MNGNVSAASSKSSSDRQDNDEGWFEFNDTRVNMFNPKDIPNETYGGENEHWESDLRQYAGDPAMQQIIQA